MVSYLPPALVGFQHTNQGLLAGWMGAHAAVMAVALEVHLKWAGQRVKPGPVALLRLFIPDNGTGPHRPHSR